MGFAILILGWAIPGVLTPKLLLFNIVLTILVLVQAKSLLTGSCRLLPMEIGLAWKEIVICGIIGCGLLVTFVTCFSPVTYYDSLVYHLALPGLYDRMGRVQMIPSNLYSFFPASIEMIFLYGINQFPNPEYVINVWQWLVTGALSIAVAEWTFELCGKRAAIISLVLWWTMPAVLLLTTGAYVDLPLGGFVFLSMRCFQFGRNESNAKWLVLSGLFSGFAMATKYTGAVCPIILTSVLLFDFVRFKRISMRLVCLFVFSAAVPIVPWLVKNWMAIGNPVFPFLYKWLGGADGWTAENAAGYFRQLTDYEMKSRLFFELARAPWSLATSATRFGGGFDVLGDFGWPLILFSAPLAIFLSYRTASVRFLTLFSLIQFFIWFCTKPVFRFLVPSLPVAILLSAIAINRLTSDPRAPVRIISYSLIAPWLISNFFLYWFIVQGLQPFSVSLGYETRNEYLSRRLNFYPVFERLNLMDSQEKVFVLGEQRTFHLSVPFVASNLFSVSPLSSVSNRARTDEEILKFLDLNKISFLLINEGEIERLGGYRKFGFTNEGERALRGFVSRHTSLTFENRRVNLYRINNY